MNNFSVPTNDFENKCRQLIGWTIQKVVYTEADLTPANPQTHYLTSDPQTHSVDFSLVLLSPDSSFAEIYWRETQRLHELSIQFNRKIEYRGSQSWDVSATAVWKSVIGKTIEDLTLYTAAVSTVGSEGKIRYQHALALHVSNAPEIYLSVAELNPEGGVATAGSNNLIVTTNKDLVRLILAVSDEFE